MNLIDTVMRLLRRDQEDQIFRAEVRSVHVDLVTLRRTGYPDSLQRYPTILTGESLSAGDEVLVVRTGRDAYIVVGQVVRDSTST